MKVALVVLAVLLLWYRCAAVLHFNGCMLRWHDNLHLLQGSPLPYPRQPPAIEHGCKAGRAQGCS